MEYKGEDHTSCNKSPKSNTKKLRQWLSEIHIETQKTEQQKTPYYTRLESSKRFLRSKETC